MKRNVCVNVCVFSPYFPSIPYKATTRMSFEVLAFLSSSYKTTRYSEYSVYYSEYYSKIQLDIEKRGNW